MASGLQAFKDDGSILFDTNYITYGLIKSGPVAIMDGWRRWILASADLNPAEESSYKKAGGIVQPITGITVFDSVSPIVFIAGDGVNVGTNISGNSKTFLFYGTTPSTKVYIFDLMRDLGGKTGMQCFSDTGQLTFTTDMPPLNVIASVSAPPLADWIPGSENTQRPYQQYTAYAGGFDEEIASPYPGDYSPYLKSVGMVPVLDQEIAAHITFTRGCGVIWRWNSPVGPLGGPGSQLGCTEGCGTSGGSLKFFFTPGPATTMLSLGNSQNIWFDIPRDRTPQALVIRTSDYPYPFR